MRNGVLVAFTALAVMISLVFASGCDFVRSLQELPQQGGSPPLTTEPPAATTTPGPTQPAETAERPASPSFQPPPISSGPSLPSIADVVANVKPSVVAVNTVVQFAGRGAGSGWILTEDGLIVTNNHVVEGARSISVTLEDGRELDVDLATVATDPITDLAVMKVNARGLPAARIGDSNRMRVGDWVVAIGNSLGEGVRATLGIVSRTDVELVVDQSTQLFGMLETDAAINPGNSGGPLVNLAGEVVGITSAKISAAEGTGFAISITEAMKVIEDLATKGFISRAYLGIQADTVDPIWVRQLDLAVSEGALITFVDPASPARRAGIEPADVVVRFGGQDVQAATDLVRAIRGAVIGEEVEIDLWRGSTRMTVTAVMGERPREF